MAVPWCTTLLHFQPNKLFKNVFCILALFGLEMFGLLFKKLGDFFQIIHPVLQMLDYDGSVDF
jgi:hypothetical protein